MWNGSAGLLCNGFLGFSGKSALGEAKNLTCLSPCRAVFRHSEGGLVPSALHPGKVVHANVMPPYLSYHTPWNMCLLIALLYRSFRGRSGSGQSRARSEAGQKAIGRLLLDCLLCLGAEHREGYGAGRQARDARPAGGKRTGGKKRVGREGAGRGIYGI